MASCEPPERGFEKRSGNEDTPNKIFSDIQCLSTKPRDTPSSSSWNFVTIHSLREDCDRDDIDKALRQKSREVADVKIYSTPHPTTRENVKCASALIGASTELFEVDVQVGFPTYPIKTLFNEECSATFSLDQNLLSEHFIRCLEQQAVRLGLERKVYPGSCKVTVAGSCKQVHKFREYLVALATRQVSLSPELDNTTTHPRIGNVPLEQPEATDSPIASPDDGNSNTGNFSSNFSPNALFQMPKLKDTPGLKYFPEEGKVEEVAASPKEKEKITSNFQTSGNCQFKAAGSMEPPASSEPEKIESFTGESSERHHQFQILGKPTAHSASPPHEKNESQVLNLSNGHVVIVKKGNIVEEEADILVNTTNTQLQHFGGVAGALNKASNGELQRHSNEYKGAKGKLEIPAGEVAVTKAGGRLKCKNVIHAVGPVAEKRNSETYCERVISDAVTNTLKEAQALKATSIVFPALGTGAFNLDPKLSALAMLNAIADFEYSEDVLKDIRIVIRDLNIYSCFSQELLQYGPVT